MAVIPLVVLWWPGNPARADERTSPSSRAALDAWHGDFTLTRKAFTVPALLLACVAYLSVALPGSTLGRL
jgi:hypothetical protein